MNFRKINHCFFKERWKIKPSQFEPIYRSNEKVFLNLVNSKRSPRMAFLSGDAKISGDTKVLKSLGKYLKHAKNNSNQSPPTPKKTNRSTSNPAAYHNISFHVEFLPVQETTTDDANIVRYAISCTLNGTTWNEYKRFNDFVKITNRALIIFFHLMCYTSINICHQ